MSSSSPSSGDAELDALIAEQNQFLRGNEAPAARLRRGSRVTRSVDVGATSSQTAEGASEHRRPTAQELAPGSGASPEVITQALRDVTLEARPGSGRSRQEQAGGLDTGTGNVQRGVRLQPPRAAEPQVLGEIVERSSSEPPKPPSAPQMPHGGGFPSVMHRSSKKFGIAPAPQQQQASAASSRSVVEQAHGPDASALMDAGASSIEDEVKSRLSAMTPDDVDSALAELRERLGPDKLAFLKQRGQRRAAGSHNGDGGKGDVGTSVAPPIAYARAAPGEMAVPPPPAHSHAAQPDDSKQQPSSAAAAVRFTLSGQVVAPDEAQQAAAMPSGISRDPLRTEGDPSAGGYTLADVVLLCRSAVPAQRVAGLRGLACILRSIRTGMGQTSGPASQRQAAPGVSWPAVYVHAVKEQRMALLLRTALDDSATSVIAAAAAATAAMVADDVQAESAWEALDGGVVGIAGGDFDGELQRQRSRGRGDGFPDGDDAASCGRHPGQPCCRARAGASWDPVVPWPDASTDSAATSGDAVDTEALDPCQALVHMSIVPRVRFLLEAAQHGGAAHALLLVLIGLARHSARAAQAAASTPRLMLMLRTCFVEATPPGGVPVLANDAGTGQVIAAPSPESPQPPEFWTCRPLALKLLRVLIECGGWPVVFAAGKEGLLVACISRFAPLPLGGAATATPAVGHHGDDMLQDTPALRREALRLWRRALLTESISVPHTESFFPVLIAALEPPSPPTRGAADATSWEACRDVYRLLTATHSTDVFQGHRLSPAASNSVMTAACRWTAPDVVCSILSAADGSARNAALAALAAALQYIRCCASNQQAGQAAMQLATAFDLATDTADSVQRLLQPLSEAARMMREGGTSPAACCSALAPLSVCHAVLAILRRGESMPATTASLQGAIATVARAMCSALDGVLSIVAAADDASKEDWMPATQRAVLATLCSAQLDALAALAGTGTKTTSVGERPAQHDVGALTRLVHAAVHIVATAPYGCDALAARAVDVITAHGVMSNLCRSGLDAAIAAASSTPGSAAHTEAASSADTVSAAQSLLPLRPPVRGVCRTRLLAAAGVKSAGGNEGSASGSRLPAPSAWPYRALGMPSGVSDWAIDAATGTSVSLQENASQEVAAALLALLMALESNDQALSVAALGKVPPAAKLRMLGAVFAASPDGVLRHPAARLTCAALTDALTCELRRDAAREEGIVCDDPDPLAAESSATDLVHRFADASFGDALHGRHVALALRARSPARARVAALHALLVDKQVAHLLPPMSAFHFSSAGHVRTPPMADVELLFNSPGGKPSFQILRLCADFLVSGRDFDRATAADALPVAIATHSVRCALHELLATKQQGGGADDAGRHAALHSLLRTVASRGPEPLRSEAASGLNALGK